MKMISVLLGTAALAASAGLASAATISLHGHAKAPHHFKSNPADRTLNVLYDQNGDDSGIATVSQNFESTFAIYDSFAADDFTTTSKWRLREVDVTGAYFNGYGPAASEDVVIYQDDKGIPGKVVEEALGVAGNDDGFGSFVITLPKLKALKGHKKYWLSVVANCAFQGGCGQWGWENQTSVVNTPAQWENPNGGYGLCPTWEDESACISGTPGDHMFTLRGKGH